MFVHGLQTFYKALIYIVEDGFIIFEPKIVLFYEIIGG